VCVRERDIRRERDARAPAYDGECYTPTLGLAMWHAFADTRGLRPPSVSPNHLASGDGAPRGTCLCPCAKVSRSQTDLLTPWHDGRAEIIPFRYLPDLLGGKGTSHVGWDTGDLPSQGNSFTARMTVSKVMSPVPQRALFFKNHPNAKSALISNSCKRMQTDLTSRVHKPC